MKLQSDFYLREDVIQIAKDLIGKVLFTNINKKIAAGIITETEAYNGVVDRASHAWNERRTARNEIMYADAGTAYVYKCYGIHDLFNVVTNQRDIPHAILIRAVYPLIGVETILKRRKMNELNKRVAGGPGTVSQSLGINMSHNGLDLFGDKIWIEQGDFKFPESQIKISARIGVESSGDAAKLPYRFYLDWKQMQTLF